MSVRYYASLTGPLLGCYYPLPEDLTTDEQRRCALNTSRLKSLWCSVYTYEQVMQQLGQYGGMGLFPDEFAGRLDYDSHAVGALIMAAPATRTRPNGDADRLLEVLRVSGPLGPEDLRTRATFASESRFSAALSALTTGGAVINRNGIYRIADGETT